MITVVFLTGIVFLVLAVYMSFQMDEYQSMYNEAAVPCIFLLLMAFLISSCVIPSCTMSKGSRDLYYRPISIQKDITNEYTVVTYREYNDCEQDLETAFIRDKDCNFPMDKFFDKRVTALTLQGDDFAKLILATPDENVLVKVVVGINFFGKIRNESPRLQYVSNKEMAMIKIQE
jgi:hypothetical protein